MPDYRLPLSDAQRLGLLPDLAPIRADMRKAVANLYSELIADNPRMPFGEDAPTCPDSELNEAQRALFGVAQMIETTPPWETALLPRMLWAARLVGIGKTLDYIEQRIRMSGNDPDALVAAYATDPDRPDPDFGQWKRRFWRDPYTYANTDWWTSIDHPEHLEFNQRVFDFALRRLPDLIALEEKG